jgi:hypothetical protein
MLDPVTAKAITEQHHAELRSQVSECRRPGGRIFPRWHVSWSRTRLSPATEKGSALVIIISASRMA